jgi:hypothetical protein
MKVKNVLVVASLFLIVILFNSCDDSGVYLSSATNVSGKIRGLLNLPLDNVKITINNKSVITSADGKFSFDIVTLPCDIYVKDSARKYEIIYKSVNTSSLTLNLPVMNNQGLVDYSLGVHYPALPTNTKGRMFFMDAENDICCAQDLTVTNIFIQAPPNLVLKGKVFLITYTVDNNLLVNEYKYFATKSDVTINPGFVTDITFTQADLLPVTADSVSIVLNPPPGNPPTYSAFILNFFNRRFSYYIQFFALATNTTNELLLYIPKNLPVEFTPSLFMLSNGESGNSQQISIIPKTGINIPINISSPPTILAPADYAVNVDLNTVFSFQKQPISNVAIYTLMDSISNVSYNLCTTENSITLSELSQMLSLSPNRNYSYYLTQVGVNVTNVGELLSAGKSIQSFSGSTFVRHFTTKP